MSNIFLTSDTHFGHDRQFIYEPRHFENIEQANEAIIERWNKVVKPEDTIYHLGDMMLGNNEKGIEYIKRLNGHIILLTGNHDTSNRMKLYAENGIECRGYADVIKYGKYHFYLSHYPTMTSNLDNDAPLDQHMINLYGHTHQLTNFYNDIPFMYHVGVDSHDCYPILIDQAIEDIKTKVEECKEYL